MNYFNGFPPESKVWIYQCNRSLLENESQEILQVGQEFLSYWNTHGKAMNASIEVVKNRFLIICADERSVGSSGCSLDKLNHFIKNVETQFSCVLLDRMLVVLEEKNELLVTHLNNLADLIKQGSINRRTLVYDSLVNSKSQLENHWLLPLEESWHQRFL